VSTCISVTIKTAGAALQCYARSEIALVFTHHRQSSKVPSLEGTYEGTFVPFFDSAMIWTFASRFRVGLVAWRQIGPRNRSDTLCVWLA